MGQRVKHGERADKYSAARHASGAGVIVDRWASGAVSTFMSPRLRNPRFSPMSGFFTRVNFIRQRIRNCAVLTRRIQLFVPRRASRFLRLCRLTDMTQKPRLEPLPPKRANRLLRAMYWYSKRRFGEVPEPFAVVAHHPRLLVAYAVHETMLQSASTQTPDQRARAGGALDCAHYRLLVVRRLRVDAAAPRRTGRQRLKDMKIIELTVFHR